MQHQAGETQFGKCSEGGKTLESNVRRHQNAKFTDEYNCKLHRLFPWPNRVETKRPLTEYGATWVVLEPGRKIPEHDHDEEECFVVVSGEATLTLGREKTTLGHGDVAYIPRHAPHSLSNNSASVDFVFVDIYWDMGGKSA